MTTAVRGVAATTDDKNLQQAIIDCALDVMDKSENLIEEAKKAVNNPQNPENQPRLAQVAKAVSQALNNCVNCLPGLREVDQAVRKVTTLSMRLANVENVSGRFQLLLLISVKKCEEVANLSCPRWELCLKRIVKLLDFKCFLI